MEKITLPELYCPFPSAINPLAAEVEQHGLAWARRFGIMTPASYQRYRATEFGQCAARVYPTAPREELLLVSDWNLWGLMKDDQTDEGELGKHPQRLTALHDRFLAVLEGAPLTGADSPLTHALGDLRARLRRKATAGQMQRFVQQVREYMAASVWETTNRRGGRTPSVDVYLHQRQYTGAIYTVLPLIEVSQRIALSPAVRNHAALHRLDRMTNNIISWSNDLFSLEKELRHGDTHNLVLALRAERGLTLQAAVERVAAMHDAEVRAFLKLEASLLSSNASADAALPRYIAGLRSWIRGYFDWSLTTSRYNSVALAEAA